VWTRLRGSEVETQAPRIAYFFFLSLPPLLMAAFALAGIFGGERTADWLTASLRRTLPADADRLVSGFVADVVHRSHPGLVSLGLLLALWSGSSVIIALEDGLNAIHGVRCARGLVKRRAVALAALLAVGGLFLAGSAVLLAGPALAQGLGLGGAWRVAQWPLGFALVVGAFWIVYAVLPNVERRGPVLAASAFAAALWGVATLAFRLYAAHFGAYSQTYGVLGGIIVLLLWMQYTSTVILVGGILEAELERTGRATGKTAPSSG
jgi:membrane protein